MTARRDPPAECSTIPTLPSSDLPACDIAIPSSSSQSNGQAFDPELDWNLGSGLFSPLATSPMAVPVAELNPRLADAAATNWDLGSETLKLILYNWFWYRGLIDRYFKIGQVRLVPRAFAEILKHSTTELVQGAGEMTPEELATWAGKVTSNTSKGIIRYSQSISREYYAGYTGDNMRWETVGIIFGLVAASTMLLPSTDPLLEGRGDRSNLTAHAVQASSKCLDLWRATGSISDISVLCIYQNLIATSMHYGDIGKDVKHRLAWPKRLH